MNSQFLHMLLCSVAILLKDNTKVMAWSCKWICIFSLSCAGCLCNWQTVRQASEWTFTALRLCSEGGVRPAKLLYTDLRLTTRSSHFADREVSLHSTNLVGMQTLSQSSSQITTRDDNIIIASTHHFTGYLHVYTSRQTSPLRCTVQHFFLI